MKVCLVQPDLAWQDRDANLQQLENLLAGTADNPDLIVLPEMFTTGFTMEPEKYAEPTGGPGFQWMERLAHSTRAAVCGSISVSDAGRFYNRLYWVHPEKAPERYDKRHLFRMGKEHLHYTAGEKKLTTALKGWNVCPLVCYDLRFPVWSRCRFTTDDAGKLVYEYDLLIYVANWPAVRSHAWKQLLVARAIENQCYVIGLNRCGTDGNGMAHDGESMVVSPLGEVLLVLDNQPTVRSFTLNKQQLVEFRQRFPAGMDADRFDIRT